MSDGALVALLELVTSTNMFWGERIVVLTASTKVPGTLTTGPTPFPNTVGFGATVKEVPLRRSKKLPVVVTDPPVKEANGALVVLVILAPSAMLKPSAESRTLIVVPDVDQVWAGQGQGGGTLLTEVLGEHAEQRTTATRVRDSTSKGPPGKTDEGSGCRADERGTVRDTDKVTSRRYESPCRGKERAGQAHVDRQRAGRGGAARLEEVRS